MKKGIVLILTIGLFLNTTVAQTQNDTVVANQQNDTIKQVNKTSRAQFTVIPPIGTNGTTSEDIANDFSFNLLGGYNGGVNYFEFGSLVNINKGNVFGGQIAGVCNINMGNTEGFQLAGVYNQTKQMGGIQIAGFMNMNSEKASGMLISGFTNIVAQDANGWMVTGFTNVVSGNFIGAQFTGFANIAHGDLTGFQLAGFINVAKKVKGVQIAFINVADTVEGLPFGFISIVKHGYHKFEASASESLYGNLSFKTGVNNLYNIFTLGFRPDGDTFYWGLGYGLGSQVNISKRVNLNFDIVGRHINENEWTETLNVLGTFNMNFSVKIAKGFEFFAGPSYNIFIYDEASSPQIHDFAPWSFYNETDGYTSIKMYMGINAGIRF